MPCLPGALLADATWYGTLAAARDLGSRGVPVTLASDALMAPARWSRHVARTVRCPSLREPEKFREWLLDFGRQNPGHVLYPTSDELAWMIARHREELSRDFRLYSPSPECLVSLLDKAQLASGAAAAGLDSPEICCPSNDDEALRDAAELGYPLYIKPRTQVSLADWTDSRKGARVERPEDFLGLWRTGCERLRYPAGSVGALVGALRPALQEYYPTSERIFTVDGFIDDSGSLYATLSCVKLLQRPRGSGAGILFEEAPSDPVVEQGLQRLFLSTGYRGVFDAEFLEDGERKLLIDVNPRFYNHMAFEVDRGLPLPWLAYLAALGDGDGLKAAVADARAARPRRRSYVHRVPAALMLGLQTLLGTMASEERRHWRRWLTVGASNLTDPAWAPGDARPAAAEVFLELTAFLRHPRSYLRHLAKRPEPGGARGGARPAKRNPRKAATG